MKQYIAMRATATSSVAVRVDSGTVQIGTDLMELVPRVATKVGNVVVVWDYTGSEETMDRKDAVEWSEMILPAFVYALVDGDQFVLLSEQRHHVND